MASCGRKVSESPCYTGESVFSQDRGTWPCHETATQVSGAMARRARAGLLADRLADFFSHLEEIRRTPKIVLCRDSTGVGYHSAESLLF